VQSGGLALSRNQQIAGSLMDFHSVMLKPSQEEVVSFLCFVTFDACTARNGARQLIETWKAGWGSHRHASAREDDKPVISKGLKKTIVEVDAAKSRHLTMPCDSYSLRLRLRRSFEMLDC
jgi:hypothetical protein